MAQGTAEGDEERWSTLWTSNAVQWVAGGAVQSLPFGIGRGAQEERVEEAKCTSLRLFGEGGRLELETIGGPLLLVNGEAVGEGECRSLSEGDHVAWVAAGLEFTVRHLRVEVDGLGGAGPGEETWSSQAGGTFVDAMTTPVVAASPNLLMRAIIEGFYRAEPHQRRTVEETTELDGAELLLAGHVQRIVQARSGIRDAVLGQDGERVRDGLLMGADVNERHQDGRTMLHVAVDLGNLDIVELL
ncbi:hypothetical protein T484DRAFT_1872082, partial [Baffinella frigidus]